MKKGFSVALLVALIPLVVEVLQFGASVIAKYKAVKASVDAGGNGAASVAITPVASPETQGV